MKNNIRKILAAAVFSAVAMVAYSQPTYTVSPPSFTAEDEVTITVDVTKTTLKDYTGDVWMWAWISDGCPTGCDAPTNVDPAGAAQNDALMTRVAPNVYSISIVPSVFYNKPPSQIKRIGFKLKTISWGDGKQSDSDVLITVEPLIFTPRINRVFPTKVTKNDFVTLYLDQSVATNLDLKYSTDDFSISIKAYNGTTEVGSLDNVNTVNESPGLHYLRILPTFTLEAQDITSIKYRFTSKSDPDLKTDEFELVFFE
jgi:hypothetical protein